MAATGYTPIYLYYSSTATNQPSAGNLGYGELAINITDKNLFFKDNTNTVNTVPIRQSGTSSNGWLSSTDWNTFNGKANSFTYTANYIPYGQGTTTPTQSANLQFDGTNLGIGLTPNTSSLSTFQSSYGIFVGNAQFNGMSNAYYDGAWKYTGSGTAARYLQSGGAHSWYTAVSGTTGSNITFNQVMQTFASGGVSIGNTTDPGAANLSVNGSVFVGVTSESGGGLVASTTRSDGLGQVLCRYDSTYSWKIGSTSAGTFVVYRNATGNAGVYMTWGATAWSANSDERMKTELTPFKNAAEKVASLRAGTGRYLTDDEGVSRSFLIAQDVQKVLPEAVNVQNDEQGTLGLQYTDVIPLLVAAIKEIKAELDATKAEVAVLKGN